VPESIKRPWQIMCWMRERMHQVSVADRVLDKRKHQVPVADRVLDEKKDAFKCERKHQVSVADRVLDERKDASSGKGSIKCPWQIVCWMRERMHQV